MAMKITEKALLDGYTGMNGNFENVSMVRGKRIIWNYRTGRQNDGYNPTCERERAGEITIEGDRVSSLLVHSRWNSHPSVARIAEGFAF
jgi:hypothetical protein